MSNSITIRGNLADDPELRFTPSGTAVCNFRVASNDTYRDSDGDWQETLNGFFSVDVWRDQAEAVAEFLRKGDRIIVTGTLKQRSWETEDGEKRWSVQMAAEEVGKSLLFIKAEGNRAKRKSKGKRSKSKTAEPTPEPEGDEEIPF